MNQALKSNQLISWIEKLSHQCDDLHIRSHDFIKLLLKLKTLEQAPTSEEVKFKSLVNAIEDAFNTEFFHFAKSFLGIGKQKSSDEFVNSLNRNEKRYHFPRILALVLQKIYLNNHHVSQKTVGDIYSIHTPDTSTYHALFPMQQQIIETEKYQSAKSVLEQKYHFTPREIYGFYEKQHILDLNKAKKIWPALTDRKGLLLRDDEIKLFLKEGVTEQLIKIATQNKDYLKKSIKDALPSHEDNFQKKREHEEHKKESTNMLYAISSELAEINKCREMLLTLRENKAAPAPKRATI